MLRFLIKKLVYGVLVLFGVVIIVFLIFQAFADPARLIVGQTGDKKTMDNIRKENIGKNIPYEIVRSGIDIDAYLKQAINNETEKKQFRQSHGITENDI